MQTITLNPSLTLSLISYRQPQKFVPCNPKFPLSPETIATIRAREPELNFCVLHHQNRVGSATVFPRTGKTIIRLETETLRFVSQTEAANFLIERFS